MNKLILSILTLAAMPGSALFAQNITGTWQGSLQGPQGPALRIVMKISIEDDKLKAVSYSIDQNPTPVPASAVTRDGSTLKTTFAALGGSWEGKIGADGNSLTGIWTQGGGPAPLNFVRATPETAWTIPEPPPPPKVMAAAAKPSFEVSTIKPSQPDARFSLRVNPSGMMNSTNTSLADLIKFAYDVHDKQIEGGPKWVDTDKFDVTGKPDAEGIPNPAQLKMMLQKMLAQRFQLMFHREKKELSVYAITVAKGGPKLAATGAQGNLPGFGGARGNMMVRNSTIAEWAGVLQANTLVTLDRPVVDQTGLGDKRWDFQLKFTPDSAQAVSGLPAPPPPADDADAPPDLFTAFQQQLGLKLESTKAPVDVMVIDKVAKPSDN
jgi:uncharacterized protein (TIGR03435 family)